MVTLLDCKYKSSIIYPYRDLKTEEDSEEDQSDRDVLLQLLSFPDLPPSLLPPPSGGWKVQENAEWGWVGFFFPLVITKAWLSLLIGWLLYSPGHFFNVSTFSELKSSKSGWYDSKLCALSVRSAQGFFWCRSPNREWRICRADGSYILFYINDATLHQAERWSGRKLFFTRPQENEKNNISVNFLRWFFWINEPLKSAGSVTNVLLIVFDLPASPNWVCRPRWIMRGWLSSFLFPNAASSAFFPWKLPEYIARLFFVF